MTDVDRRALVGLAYRMLGSLTEAEDIAQEALLRWHQYPDKHAVQSPKAFIERVAARLCLDRLKSARARREVYVGPWLPEPLLDDEGMQPGAERLSELASDLSVALLLTLERLSPLERAAFVLHDVFDTDWPEVAATLRRSEPACRQLASRARQRVREEHRRFHPSEETRERVMEAFAGALATGDTTTLASLLAEDVVFVSDGGGHVKAALKPVQGRDRVTRLVFGLYTKGNMADGFAFRAARINGLAGIIVEQGGEPLQAAAFDIAEDGTIQAVYVVVNPEKLRHLARGD